MKYSNSRLNWKDVKSQSSVGCHAITVEVLAHAYTQHLGKTLVEAYPVANLVLSGLTIFESELALGSGS